jgi:hypothetical protein
LLISSIPELIPTETIEMIPLPELAVMVLRIHTAARLGILLVRLVREDSRVTLELVVESLIPLAIPDTAGLEDSPVPLDTPAMRQEDIHITPAHNHQVMEQTEDFRAKECMTASF